MGISKIKTDQNKTTTIDLLSKDLFISDHLRAIKRMHFIRQLDKERVEKIIRFRQEFKITYEWKERIRKRYEQIIYSKKHISNFVAQDYVHNERAVVLYKKIKGTSNILDTKNILLMQYIAIEHYLAYGTGIKKQTKEDKLRDMLMVDGADYFLKVLKKLSDDIEIKHFNEWNEEPSPTVRCAIENLKEINPAVIEYVFNTEAPITYEDFKACYTRLNKGIHTLLFDGLYLPFEKFHKIKETEFVELCRSLYRGHQELFDERDGMSSGNIIAYINTWLLRDVDELDPKHMGDIFLKGNAETRDKTVNAEISKIKKLLGMDPISPEKHRSKKQKKS